MLSVKNVPSTKTFTRDEAMKASMEYFKGDKFAADVFLNKYALIGDDNKFLESTPEAMHWRMAREFARIEKNYPNPMSEQEIFDLFHQFKYVIPQGSPMSAIGNDKYMQSLSNCFVIKSPTDSYAGILRTDQEEAQIMKRRGGVGFDISEIRPKGMATSNAARTTDGIGVFMERFSNTCREVAQGGRRGALMLSVSCHHPEIRTFIDIKRDRKKVTGANCSIRLSNEFMEAVRANEEVELRWPVDSATPKIREKTDAKKLWDSIIDAAWTSAEPGLLFWDTVKAMTPADIYASVGYASISTNPCVTEDTWIMTANGPTQVKDLVGIPFDALVSGQAYKSPKGFWKTGNKDTIKITTAEGFSIQCTPNHKLLTLNAQGQEEWKEAKDLVTGTRLVLDNHSNQTWNGSGTYGEGYLLGSLIGDGCISSGTAHLSWWGSTKKHMYEFVSELAQNSLKCRADLGTGNTESDYCTTLDKVGFNSVGLKHLADDYNLTEAKNITPEIEASSPDFYRGILSGWFDADGTVGYSSSKQSTSVRLCSVNLQNLYAAQRMLARLGIISKIYTNRREAGTRLLPDGKGGSKPYHCQATHELCISKTNVLRFQERVGFADPDKSEKLAAVIDKLSESNRGFYKESFTAKVASLTQSGTQDVYDCTVETVHRFDANGITAHNCAELILSQYDSCRLLCLNLMSFVSDPYTANARFNFTKYRAIVLKAQRLMDDLVDLEIEAIDKILKKIVTDPDDQETKAYELKLWQNIREAAVNGRRTGLGITALGDTIAALGMKYGDKDSIQFTSDIYKALAVESYRSSVIMAKERGPFPVFSHKLEDGHPFLQRIWDEDPELYSLYVAHGRRNIANTTTAPTGSVSTLTQTTSGIEPAAFIHYCRRRKVNPSDKNVRVDFVDQTGDSWEEYLMTHKGFLDWAKINGKIKDWTDEEARKYDKDVDIPFFKESPYFGATCNDVDWLASVEIQAAAQKWVCHAISKTCNLPKTATRELVSQVYMKAWESGCKGFTVYRDGCRSGVIVTNDEKTKKEEWKKRPQSISCDVFPKVMVKGSPFFVIVGKQEDRPYEVFAGVGALDTHAASGQVIKHKRGEYEFIADDGSRVSNVCDLATDDCGAITRLMSLALRHNVDIKFIIQQLEKTPGDLNSFGRAIARTLKKYIPDGEKENGTTCPQCGNNSVTRQEGCISCACGWSKCS